MPFVLALIIYYLLLPLKLEALMGGVSHDSAAGLVARAFLALAARFSSGTARHGRSAMTWQESSLPLSGWRTRPPSQLRLCGSWKVDLPFWPAAQVANNSPGWLPDIPTNLPNGIWRFRPWVGGLGAFDLTRSIPCILYARDGWRFAFSGGVPNAFFERTLYLLDQVDRTARLYFIGLIQPTLLDAVCLAIGLWIIGITRALFLGLANGNFAWIPYIGSILGCPMVSPVAATDFPGQPEIAYGTVVCLSWFVSWTISSLCR